MATDCQPTSEGAAWNNARFRGRCCICVRILEELFGDAPTLVVIELHYADSVDRVMQPVVDDNAMFVVRGGRRRRRQLPNFSAGRRAVVGRLCSVKVVLVQLRKIIKTRGHFPNDEAAIKRL